MNSTRLLLADDYELVRAGIRLLLKDIAGIEVVAEAANGHDCMQAILELRPDVALVDLQLPGLNGLEIVRRVTREAPHVRVIILSVHTNKSQILQALQAGAAGYLGKKITSTELELAIHAVMRDEIYLHSAISTHSVARFDRGTDAGPVDHISERQREVLRLIAEGGSTKSIAVRLKLSVKTVEMHRANLMKRLGIRDIAGLVRFAIRHGLVSAET